MSHHLVKQSPSRSWIHLHKLAIGHIIKAGANSVINSLIEDLYEYISKLAIFWALGKDLFESLPTCSEGLLGKDVETGDLDP